MIPDGDGLTGPLLQVSDLVKHFPVRAGIARTRVRGWIKAVDGVSFAVARGQTLALVGESGCGKSTTARAVLRLVEPTAGSVRLDGEEVTTASAARLRQLRRRMQIVFQDPLASLDPRMTVRRTLAEPFDVHDLPEEGRIDRLLERVGLSPEHAHRYPHELSGGQRQRVGVARAIALEPDLVVCDEPVSALDVSIRAQVLNLLADLQETLGLAYLMIAHDLALVRRVADEVAVMYLGAVVEQAPAEQIFEQPSHPYTRALVSAVPMADPIRERARARIVLAGDPPSPRDPPSGCRFRTRCPVYAGELSEAERRACWEDRPLLEARGDGPGHLTACHYAGRGRR